MIEGGCFCGYVRYRTGGTPTYDALPLHDLSASSRLTWLEPGDDLPAYAEARE
jgi:hypothetical protein